MGLFNKRRKDDDVNEVADVDAWLKTLDGDVEAQNTAADAHLTEAESSTQLAVVGANEVHESIDALRSFDPASPGSLESSAPPPPPSASDRRSGAVEQLDESAAIESSMTSLHTEQTQAPQPAVEPEPEDGVWHLPDFEADATTAADQLSSSALDALLPVAPATTEPVPWSPIAPAPDTAELPDALQADGIDFLNQLGIAEPAASSNEPSAFEAPAFEAPAFEAPAFEAPAFEAPAFEAPAFEAEAFEPPAFEAEAFEPPPFESTDAGDAFVGGTDLVEGLPDLPTGFAAAEPTPTLDPAASGFVVDVLAAESPDEQPAAPWSLDAAAQAPAVEETPDADPFAAITALEAAPHQAAPTDPAPVGLEPTYELSSFGIDLDFETDTFASSHETRSPSLEPGVPDSQPVISLSHTETSHAETSHTETSHTETIEVPTNAEAAAMLAILGLDRTASWSQVKSAHQTLLSDHTVPSHVEPDRAAAAQEIRRDINAAYVGLRLQLGPELSVLA